MYSFASRVRYSETNEDGRLSLVSLVNYFQDCSLFQTEALGVGMDHLEEVQLAWLIAGWQIEIETLPRHGDSIVVSTWPCTSKGPGLLAHRNYTLCSDTGKVYARADALWFMFDRAKQRPIVAPEEEWAPYVPEEAPRLDMPKTQRKLRINPALTPRSADKIVVRAQHLDTNHHVNNAQYIEFARMALAEVCANTTHGAAANTTTDVATNAAMDTIADVAHGTADTIAAKPQQIKRICVQYVHAAVLGDSILPLVYVEDDAVSVRLVRDAHNTGATSTATPDTDITFAIVKFLNA